MFDRPLDFEHPFGHHRAMHRTYVRRRRTVAIVGTALIAVLLSPLAAGAVRRGEAPAAPAQQVVVVRAGDTLWSIAERVRPGADPRETIAEIERMNASVDPGAILPGQTLAVPVG
jgi:nucleoid-associated protein YgaU